MFSPEKKIEKEAKSKPADAVDKNKKAADKLSKTQKKPDKPFGTNYMEERYKTAPLPLPPTPTKKPEPSKKPDKPKKTEPDKMLDRHLRKASEAEKYNKFDFGEERTRPSSQSKTSPDTNPVPPKAPTKQATEKKPDKPFGTNYIEERYKTAPLPLPPDPKKRAGN